MDGWICLHRQIKGHWLYQERRVFSRFEAWVDLLMMANHKDGRFPLGNEIIEVKRGDVVTSEVKLMEQWGWSKTKVRAFLSVLESDEMILKKTDRKKTTITIVNYKDFNDLQTTEKPIKNHGETTKRPQKDTINNVNNENNVNQKSSNKIIYAENVMLTFEEYEKLVKEYGEEMTLDCIRVLDNYKGANDKKYKSDYRAMLTWVVQKVEDDMRRKNVTYLNKRPGKPTLPIVSNDGAKPPSEEEQARMQENLQKMLELEERRGVGT